MEALFLASVAVAVLIGASLIMLWYDNRAPKKPDDD